MVRSEGMYHDQGMFWYDRWWGRMGVSPEISYHSISCVCVKCTQADYNVCRMASGLRMAVRGL